MKISNLFKSASVYTANGVLNKLIPFLLLPIFTRLLSEEDYGIWGTYIAIASGIAPLIGLSSNAALSRHYWDMEPDELSGYLGDLYKIVISVFGFLITAAFLFGDFLVSVTGIPFPAVAASILTGFIQFSFTVPLLLLQLKDKPVKYTTFSVLSSLFAFGIAFLLIAYFDFKWEGYVFGYTMGTLLIMLLLVSKSYREYKIKLFNNNGYMEKIAKYGLGYLVAAISVWIINMSDRLFINNLVGLNETGLYTIGYSFGSIMLMVNVAFSRSWLPFFYTNIKKEEHESDVYVIKTTYLYWVLLLIGAALLSYIGPYVMKIFVDEKFYSGAQYIPWVAFGYAFFGMSKTLEGYLHYVERPKIISMIQGSISILNLVLNYFLIMELGAIGAAISTFITFVAGFVINFIVSNKNYSMPWLLREK